VVGKAGDCLDSLEVLQGMDFFDVELKEKYKKDVIID